MRAALSLTLALGACVQTAPQWAVQGYVAQGSAVQGSAVQGSVARVPLRVTNAGVPFRMYEGAAARRIAEAECAAQGRRLRPGIHDRFEAGAWVYVEGCA